MTPRPDVPRRTFDAVVKFEEEAPFVAEGTCPACRGRLVTRYGDLLAGSRHPSVPRGPYAECVPCRRGYQLRRSGPEQAWLGPMVLVTLYLDAIGGTLSNTSGPAGPDAFKAAMECGRWPG